MAVAAGGNSKTFEDFHHYLHTPNPVLISNQRNASLQILLSLKSSNLDGPGNEKPQAAY
jgi:hypothetical protein